MIPISKCKDGYLYRIVARNASLGIWNEKNKSFSISRFKFGDNFIFEEFHWETGPPYGTARPLEELEKSPNLQSTNQMIVYLNEATNELLAKVTRQKNDSDTGGQNSG